jgi:hypothetical protein
VRRRASAVAFAALVLALGAALPASGANGPDYILVYGGGLDGTVLLDDRAGNELLVTSPDVEPRTGVPREADRPVYELALFFIVPDLAGRSPSDLRPEETGASGRFFPAVGELEAIFELGPVPGIGPRRDGGLTPPMLDYLVSRGVEVVSSAVLGPEEPTPTPESVPGRFVEPDDGGGVPGWLLAAGAAALAGVGLVAWALVRRERRPRRRGVHF